MANAPMTTVPDHEIVARIIAATVLVDPMNTGNGWEVWEEEARAILDELVARGWRPPHAE